MWGLVASFLTSSVTSYFEHKQKKNELKQELELKKISETSDWDSKNADARKGSWADEWFIVIFSFPLINLFLSPFVDLWMSEETYKKGQLAEAANTALESLNNAPDWYIIILLVMVSASFGYKKLADLATQKKIINK